MLVVALEVRHAIEVHMPTMLEPQLRAAGEDEGQAGVAVAVPVSHAAAVERHRRVDERAVRVLHLLEAADEIAELRDVERIALQELPHQVWVAVVVRERVAVLLDANLRHRRPLAFQPGGEGRHAGHVRLERQHDDVIHRAEIIPEHLERDVAVELRVDGRLDGGAWGVEPLVRTPGADFDLAHGGEVLLQPPLVFAAELAAQALRLFQDRVNDAPAPLKTPPLLGDAALRVLEQFAERKPGAELRRQLDAIGIHRQRTALIAQLQRGIARERRGHLRHELVHRNGVAHRLPNLPARQPDALAIVVVPHAVGMMQPAERRDDIAVRLQRRERLGQLVVRAGLLDLIVGRVDAVGQVDEDAAPGLERRGRRGRAQRHHAVKERQGQRDAEALERVPAGEQPVLAGSVHGRRRAGRTAEARGPGRF